MKACQRCFKEFIAEELGDIFLEKINYGRIDDLCPECRIERGLINGFGFGEECVYVGY